MIDIIGDIHGHAEALKTMLEKLGYEYRHDTYRHPQARQLIFVGDLIDRGPQIREVVRIVRRLCDEGTARLVMGNHEYNAICFHTPHVERGGFFRKHRLKEIKQHIQTLESYQGHDSEWADTLDWFRTLPLFIEEYDFRVVHACWQRDCIEWLQTQYRGMNPDFLSQCTDENDAKGAHTAIEMTLKGPEWELPAGYSLPDKDGNHRSACRVRWWAEASRRHTFGEILVHGPRELSDIPAGEMVSVPFYDENIPVFFGHYALQETPGIHNPLAVCLDFNVIRGGGLVAARLQRTKDGLQYQLVN